MLRIAVNNWQSAFNPSQNIFTAEVAKDAEKRNLLLKTWQLPISALSVKIFSQGHHPKA
jgi:hypothetical protein